VGDGAGFFLTGNLPTQCIVAIFTLAAVRQAFFRKKGTDLFLKKAARTGGGFSLPFESKIGGKPEMSLSPLCFFLSGFLRF